MDNTTSEKTITSITKIVKLSGGIYNDDGGLRCTAIKVNGADLSEIYGAAKKWANQNSFIYNNMDTIDDDCFFTDHIQAQTSKVYAGNRVYTTKYNFTQIKKEISI